jgi:hypothetical protein
MARSEQEAQPTALGEDMATWRVLTDHIFHWGLRFEGRASPVPVGCRDETDQYTEDVRDPNLPGSGILVILPIDISCAAG